MRPGAILYLAASLTLGLASPAEPRGVGSPGIGPTGAMGEPGERGPRGNTGAKGDAGPQGVPGSAGAPGGKGDRGDVGPKGETGAQGPQGSQGVPGVAGQPGAKGADGAQGVAGPKATAFVCNATITETALVAISSGVRAVAGVSCPGALTTDLLLVLPTSATGLLAGYAVHHALPTAANTLRIVLQVPALAVGASYSIPVAVYAVNR